MGDDAGCLTWRRDSVQPPSGRLRRALKVLVRLAQPGEERREAVSLVLGGPRMSVRVVLTRQRPERAAEFVACEVRLDPRAKRDKLIERAPLVRQEDAGGARRSPAPRVHGGTRRRPQAGFEGEKAERRWRRESARCASGGFINRVGFQFFPQNLAEYRSGAHILSIGTAVKVLNRRDAASRSGRTRSRAAGR